MSRTVLLAVLLSVNLIAGSSIQPKKNEPQFQTSDRCQACHNGLTTNAGTDISIGFHWRASIMANSSHDPYWQASVRREVIDHPEAQPHIEDECSICHMPITRYEAKLRGKTGEIFSHLPISTDDDEHRQAADGVSCSICHQITTDKLGTPASYNGGFTVHGPDSNGTHPEYGPFAIEEGLRTIMRSSSDGYRPQEGVHIRDSEICATCHTLITAALGADGKSIGALNEQMPYQEWLHSDYRNTRSCQSCHMPSINEPVQVSRVLGELREGARLHSFVGGNFFMLDMLNRYRGDLNVAALPPELTSNAAATRNFLQSQTASVAIGPVRVAGGQLETEIEVHNRDGHKLPTAYPARRAWIHFLVRDRNGTTVFESGALQPDGSIVGNDNDADPLQYEPHYGEIHSTEQVQIYESILGDANGHVTTGLLSAVRYLKDNRLLPDGFDKETAAREVEVVGGARTDPDFCAGGDSIRYKIPVGQVTGPLEVSVELRFQPIGYRWAHNLEPYGKAAEPKRFTGYYKSLQGNSAVVLASASVTWEANH